VLAAPVTTGRSTTTYTLADAVSTRPPQAASFFAERLVLLPTSAYPFAHGTWATRDLPITLPTANLPSVSVRGSSTSVTPTRWAEGLDCCSLVLSSFVQRWKLNPIVWPAWLNVLRRAPRSVLWILQHALDSPPAISGSGDTGGGGAGGGPAARFGGLSAMLALELIDIHSRRLVVMRRMPLENHVLRTGLADLTLDTHPYSAHTTAADSLWLHGPPWLALSAGDRFDSRLSTSVLAGVGSSESSAHSLRAFEDLALELATGSRPT